MDCIRTPTKPVHVFDVYHLEEKDIPRSNVDERVVDDDSGNFWLTWTKSKNIEFHSASPSVLFILDHNLTLRQKQHHMRNATQDQQTAIHQNITMRNYNYEQWTLLSLLESILLNSKIFLKID